MDHAVSELRIVSDEGSGRVFALIYEAGRSLQGPAEVGSQLASKSRVLAVESPIVGDDNWKSLTSQLEALLRERAVRQASFVSFGATGSLVQNLALQDLKFVRTMVLVDASTRPHPTRMSRWVDSIERRLPLGLPLRLASRGFDSKPFLQRVRCPVLVVSSPWASSYQRSEAFVLERSLPSAWAVTLGGSEIGAELARLCVDFHDIPAKCPQKGRQAAA